MPRIPVGPNFYYEQDVRRLAITLVDDLTSNTVILPALYLQHNPQTMKLSHSKIINRYTTFGGMIEEHWGEELDTLTCAGTTGGFIAEEFGYNTFDRKNTLAYHKFEDILDVYRNNGNVYDSLGRVIQKGYVNIFFDPTTYFGEFESFNYIEDANNPYRFTFDFVFKVDKTYSGI